MIRVLTQITLAAILVVAVWSVSIQWAWAQASIVDPSINNAVDVTGRQVAEIMKRFHKRAQWDIMKWYEISATVPNDETILENPARAGDGLTPVTGADLHNIMYLYTVLYSTLDDSAAMATISKFCVRQDDVIFGQ